MSDKPCKLHTGRIRADGYGAVGAFLAHRVAYAQKMGVELAALQGIHVRHTCDNPPCIEHDHLIEGTHADNMQDKADRGRAPQIDPKLTAEQATAIRAQYIPRHPLYGARALGREYGIAHCNILRIVKGLSYK